MAANDFTRLRVKSRHTESRQKCGTRNARFASRTLSLNNSPTRWHFIVSVCIAIRVVVAPRAHNRRESIKLTTTARSWFNRKEPNRDHDGAANATAKHLQLHYDDVGKYGWCANQPRSQHAHTTSNCLSKPRTESRREPCRNVAIVRLTPIIYICHAIN